MLSTIIIASAAAAIIAVPVIWYLLSNKKKQDEPIEEPKEEPIEEPVEQPQEPEPVEEPVEEPQLPTEEPEPVDPEPVEDPQEPVLPVEEPKPEPQPDPVDEYRKMCGEVIEYFSNTVKIGPKTEEYLRTRLWNLGEFQDLFPVIYDYFGEKDNENAAYQCLAWKYAMILAEIVPTKREQLYKLAYEYKAGGKKQPIYGWTKESDPNIARLVASITYAISRDSSKIDELRKECGGSTLTYVNKINEVFIDLSKFMPAAPGPYIPAYSSRTEVPVDAKNTENIDKSIHEHISRYYNLDTKDAEKRQRTIQAIADKETYFPHIFGKDRTVDGVSHGKMTFHPVFGKHNLGFVIPDNGAIAKLCEAVAMPSSNNRKSLLTPNYGRRRPGLGDIDPSANPIPEQRALVNYAIEEGDGFTTGYYNNNGDYIKYDGTHIGDYGTYFQSQLYANSYPSGHSTYIWAIALILMEVMPDKAAEIAKAANEFAVNRTVARYHWTSDTIMGRVIGSTLIPVLHATTNVGLDKLILKAKEEYNKIKL